MSQRSRLTSPKGFYLKTRVREDETRKSRRKEKIAKRQRLIDGWRMKAYKIATFYKLIRVTVACIVIITFSQSTFWDPSLISNHDPLPCGVHTGIESLANLWLCTVDKYVCCNPYTTTQFVDSCNDRNPRTSIGFHALLPKCL